jgi:hypothetical protein
MSGAMSERAKKEVRAADPRAPNKKANISTAMRGGKTISMAMGNNDYS